MGQPNVAQCELPLRCDRGAHMVFTKETFKIGARPSKVDDRP